MDKLTSMEAFDSLIARNGTVVVDFSAPGCGPCKKVPGLLAEVLPLAPEGTQAAEADLSVLPALAQRFMVLSVPTIIIFRDGKEQTRFSGVPAKDKLLGALK